MNKTGYEIVALGNALVDIQVQVGNELLQEFSLPKGTMTLSSPQTQSALLKKIISLPKEISSGGSAANTVHGMGRLGSRAYYIGKTANDEYGRHYRQDMELCGLGFSLPQTALPENLATGTCLVFITPDAQRTMLTYLGASASLSASDIDDSIVKQAQYLYIEGYLFTQDSTREAALHAARIAKSHSIPVAFTLSDTFVIENFYNDIYSFIEEYVNIIFCNEAEGLALAKANNPQHAFEKISDFTDTVFFTRGENPAWLKNAEEKKVEVKSFNVKALDTTGAGDLFAAGALFGLLQKRNLHECGILGNYCASQVITHLQARLPHGAAKQIDEILALYSQQLN